MAIARGKAVHLSLVESSPLLDGIDKPFFQIPSFMASKAIRHKLTASDMYLWFYLQMLDPFGDRAEELPTIAEIADAIGVSTKQGLRSWNKLYRHGFTLHKPPMQKPPKRVEEVVQKRLQAQEGGLIEVQTLVGRIDLLTDSEIFEIKSLKDWKSALGQVLAYSAYYPQHKKRLHLFTEKGSCCPQALITLIVNTCQQFDVFVTFEEVEA